MLLSVCSMVVGAGVTGSPWIAATEITLNRVRELVASTEPQRILELL